MEVEKKLLEYRTRKRKQAYVDKVNQTFKSFFTFKSRENEMSNQNLNEAREDDLLIKDDYEINETRDESLIKDDDEITSDSNEVEVENNFNLYLTVIYRTLLFIFWAILYSIFIKLQFGTVYLILSALIFIYFNTRTKPKLKNEISAYSVFNKNCESIQGSLKAEQFEQEIRYGTLVSH